MPKKLKIRRKDGKPFKNGKRTLVIKKKRKRPLRKRGKLARKR